MKNKLKFDKLLLDRQYENLKKRKGKVDHNDIVLIASALQQQMVIDQGYYKPNKNMNKINMNYKKSITKKEDTIPEFLPKLVNKNAELEQDSEKQIYSRRKQYMSNLSLGKLIPLIY